MITIAQLDKIAGKKVDRPNAQSFLSALEKYGPRYGLLPPHRLAQELAQVMHESGAFRYDREIWGPTPAQQRYDTRVDLGNTPEKDGDGKKNLGRGPIQLTGGGNIKRFHEWCVKEGLAPPNFVENPDLINTDPWEGLSFIWYWEVGNPTGKSLNRYADIGDVEMVTKKVNGGLNGFDDRLRYLARASLVLLGRDPNSVEKYQREKGLAADGISGPQTRAALHADLLALTPGATEAKSTSIAPVTEKKPVAAVPKELDKPTMETKGFWERIFTLVGLSGIGGASWLGDWKVILALAVAVAVVTVIGLVFHNRIITAVKELKGAING
ncbi:MAG: glycoside hydrolase family 19 protein [Hyphomicrobiaceae bacterium]|nr:MAG: glycoside hydrolase family 19 protein [Hyphomicrobiaceae bacterium]